MGKAYKDYSVADVVRLAGYWLHKDADQMEALSYIYLKLNMIGTSPNEVKLLDTFGSGGNRIETDKAKLDDMIFGASEYELDKSTANSIARLSKSAMLGELREAIDNLNQTDESVLKLKSQIRELLTKREEQAKIVAATLSGSSSKIENIVRSVESSSTFRYMGSDGSQLKFIQSTPTLISDIDVDTGSVISIDLGRYSMCLNIGCDGSYTPRVSSGYRCLVSDKGYIHPNISLTGRLCFGNNAADFGMAKISGNYSEVARMLDGLLRTASFDMPYESFEEFRRASVREDRISMNDEAMLSRVGLTAYQISPIVPKTGNETVYFADGDLTIHHGFRLDEFPSIIKLGQTNEFITDDSVDIDHVMREDRGDIQNGDRVLIRSLILTKIRGHFYSVKFRGRRNPPVVGISINHPTVRERYQDSIDASEISSLVGKLNDGDGIYDDDIGSFVGITYDDSVILALKIDGTLHYRIIREDDYRGSRTIRPAGFTRIVDGILVVDDDIKVKALIKLRVTRNAERDKSSIPLTRVLPVLRTSVRDEVANHFECNSIDDLALTHIGCDQTEEVDNASEQ